MPAVQRILTATDFSPGGNQAVARAAQLAKLHGAQLQVVHALPSWSEFSQGYQASEHVHKLVLQQAVGSLEREARYVQATFNVAATGVSDCGKASEVIAKKVNDFNPDLLVLGARGEHSASLAPASLGGTALKLLQRLGRPILFVRGDDYQDYSIVLAAVREDEPLAARITGWALAMLRSGDCHILHAYHLPYLSRLKGADINDVAIEGSTEDARSRAHKHLVSVCQAMQARSVRTHPHVVEGSPLPVLLTEITRHAPQLLILGRSEQRSSPAGESPPSSLTQQLAYHAPIDVLIVP